MGYVSYSVSGYKHHFEPGPYMSSDFQFSIELNPTDIVMKNSCFYHRADTELLKFDYLNGIMINKEIHENQNNFLSSLCMKDSIT